MFVNSIIWEYHLMLFNPSTTFYKPMLPMKIIIIKITVYIIFQSTVIKNEYNKKIQTLISGHLVHRQYFWKQIFKIA